MLLMWTRTHVVLLLFADDLPVILCWWVSRTMKRRRWQDCCGLEGAMMRREGVLLHQTSDEVD